MPSGLRIRRLRLRGIGRDYDVSFTTPAGEVQPLSIVAGEISTGKTSVLEFVDFCLGASDHPRHPEIASRVRSALLELEIDGRVAVVERPVFGSKSEAWVHWCSMAEMAAEHAREKRQLAPAGDPRSLSTLLLAACGLAGMSLKEAPTQDASGVDPLSFRDVMWVCFLENNRLDSRNLVFEANYMKALKLTQVVNVLFGIHMDALASASAQLSTRQKAHRQLEDEVASLSSFLEEQDVLGQQAIAERRAALSREVTALQDQLHETDSQMAAATGFAQTSRRRYQDAAKRAGLLAARLRDRETLLNRLLLLRGQYAEDLEKLVFLEEANSVFDPLRVIVCPACSATLTESPNVVEGGTCSLCGNDVAASGDETIDVKAELRSVQRRLRELNRYINEVEHDVDATKADLEKAGVAEQVEQRAVDEMTHSTLSPFITQRDRTLADIATCREKLGELDRASDLRKALAAKASALSGISEELRELEKHIAKLKESAPDRDYVAGELSKCFDTLLGEFRFPKLHDAGLDDKYIPHVRGLLYSKLGSSGAFTLVSLAWFLAILETSASLGAAHPGFLMMDSPQKNLTHRGGQPGDEFTSSAIVTAVYAHLMKWADGPGRRFQLIVVDNEPPTAAENRVVKRYSLNPNRPPYGLIDDEIGTQPT